jgi:hypothetical protein
MLLLLLSQIKQGTILREGLLFKTKILWGLENKELSWFGDPGNNCHSVWKGDSYMWSWRRRRPDMHPLKSFNRREHG